MFKIIQLLIIIALVAKVEKFELFCCGLKHTSGSYFRARLFYSSSAFWVKQLKQYFNCYQSILLHKYSYSLFQVQKCYTFATSVKDHRSRIYFQSAFYFPPMMHVVLSQRARVGPGKPTDSSSSSSSVCKYDSNGNQDRVKLSDFNFIMVLGKGSFGKVWRPSLVSPRVSCTNDCRSLLCSWLGSGDAGGAEGHRRAVRH